MKTRHSPTIVALCVALLFLSGCRKGGGAGVMIVKATVVPMTDAAAPPDMKCVQVITEFRNKESQLFRLCVSTFAGRAMQSELVKQLGPGPKGTYYLGIEGRSELGAWSAVFVGRPYRVNGRVTNPAVEHMLEIAPGQSLTYSIPVIVAAPGINRVPKNVRVYIEDYEGHRTAEKEVSLRE